MIKDDREESAGGYVDSGDELIKRFLPENKNTPISMGCGESYFRIDLIIRIERAAIIGDEVVCSNWKIRLKKPRFRQKYKV